jgi:hypothetical protein
MGRPKLSVLDPRMTAQWLEGNKYTGADVPSNINMIMAESDNLSRRKAELPLDVEKEKDGKGWFETNLDESVPVAKSNSSKLFC